MLDVHGGTSERDILEAFAKAEDALSGGASTSFVFLDEVNTCAHMALITEAICSRSLKGRPLPGRLRIIAALNPYRLRTGDERVGLVYNLGEETTPDAMANLVYRVHPIPPALQEFAFDFGAISDQNEQQCVF